MNEGHDFLSQIPIDLLQHILAYLNITEILGRVLVLNHRLFERISCLKNKLSHDKAVYFLKHCWQIPSQRLTPNDCDWLKVLRSLTAWPSNFNFDMIKLLYGLFINTDKIVECKNIAGQGIRGVVYQGTQLGGNRCIVADGHFPVIPYPTDIDYRKFQNPSTIARSKLPFVKAHISAETLQTTLVFSCVAYYEIKLYDPSAMESGNDNMIHPFDGRNIQHPRPCVCIGLCLAGFPLTSDMPGWKPNSFGYHGDDGMLFHGSSSQSTTETMPGPSTFGVNDTVGCGLLYPPYGANGRGGVFYTKNGTLIAEYPFQYAGVLANAWYPIVGIDSYSPVEMNCGSKPFQFDVLEYEKTHLRKLSLDQNTINAFQITGEGISHFLNLSSVGYTNRTVSIHPAIKDPWEYLRGLLDRHIPERFEKLPRIKLKHVYREVNISFDDDMLGSETIYYNRSFPEYCDSVRDAYRSRNVGIGGFDMLTGVHMNFLEFHENEDYFNGDDGDSDDDDDYSQLDEYDDDDDDYDDDDSLFEGENEDDNQEQIPDEDDEDDEDEEDFVVGGADEADFGREESGIEYHDIKCPCGGIGAEYDVDDSTNN